MPCEQAPSSFRQPASLFQTAHKRFEVSGLGCAACKRGAKLLAAPATTTEVPTATPAPATTAAPQATTEAPSTTAVPTTTGEVYPVQQSLCCHECHVNKQHRLSDSPQASFRQLTSALKALAWAVLLANVVPNCLQHRQPPQRCPPQHQHLPQQLPHKPLLRHHQPLQCPPQTVRPTLCSTYSIALQAMSFKKIIL